MEIEDPNFAAHKREPSRHRLSRWLRSWTKIDKHITTPLMLKEGGSPTSSIQEACDALHAHWQE
eukprot:8846645-Alexandrium_andersonii.AAC.1